MRAVFEKTVFRPAVEQAQSLRFVHEALQGSRVADTAAYGKDKLRLGRKKIDQLELRAPGIPSNVEILQWVERNDLV